MALAGSSFVNALVGGLLLYGQRNRQLELLLETKVLRDPGLYSHLSVEFSAYFLHPSKMPAEGYRSNFI